MKKFMRTTTLAAAIIFLLIALVSCSFGGGTITEAFTGFEISGLRIGYSYTLNETISFEIRAKAAKAESYNVYLKINDEAESKVKSLTDGGKYSYTFEELGEYKFKIVAVLDGVEKTGSSGKFEFTATVSDVSEITVTDNVIDLYVSGGEKTFKWEDLAISAPIYTVYRPDPKTTNAYYTMDSDRNVTAVSGRGEPFVFTLVTGDKKDVCTKVYLRIHENTTKAVLTDFMVDYPGTLSTEEETVGKTYGEGDWISFQCVEFAGQNPADSYSVQITEDGGETYKLLSKAGGNFKIEVKNGHTVYSVKAVKSGTLDLKFTAVKSGEEGASATISVPIAAEPVSPESITLAEASKILMKDQTYTIVPTVLPEETTDKRVTYSISEGGEEFVSVDGNGLVTALKTTTAPVEIRVASKVDSTIYATFRVSVTDIDVELSSAGGGLTQTLGDKSGNEKHEDIDFTLSGAPSGSTYVWYRDNTVVQASSASNTFTFRTTALNVAGSYAIRVQVTTTSGVIEESATVTLKSGVLNLPSLSESYFIGEAQNILVVPKKLAARVELVLCKINGEFVESVTNNAEFTFNDAGTYKIKISLFDGEALTPYEIRLTDAFDVIDASSHEIFNLHVTGLKSGGDAFPYVKWKRLGRDVKYTVEITKGLTITTAAETDNDYRIYFTDDGFIVPSEIASLSDTFTVRVKTDIGNRYSGNVTYGGEITAPLYGYLEPVVGNTTRYINNILDFSDVMNYVKNFRPSIYDENGIEFYMALDYDADMEALYGVWEAEGYDSHGTETAAKLMAACNQCYFEGGGMSYQISSGSNGEASVIIKVTKTDTTIPTKTMQNTTPEANFASWLTTHKPKLDPTTLYTLKDDTLAMKQAYAAIPRGTANVDFPINEITATRNVSTTNELYMAVYLGFKPTPIASSAADAVYTEAKAILNRIISDGMTNNQKATAIYDFLASEIVYDDYVLAYYEYLNATYGANDERSSLSGYKAFTLEGALLDKIAVCDGISKAFVLLCGIEDIPVFRVTGTANAGNHAWNIVLGDDGQWYNFDATWGRQVTEKVEGGEDYAGIKHFTMFASEDDFADHTQVGVFPQTAQKHGNFYYVQYDASRYIKLDEEDEFSDMLNAVWNEMSTENEYMIDVYFEYKEFGNSEELRTYIGGLTTSPGFGISYFIYSNGEKYQYVTLFYFKK